MRLEQLIEQFEPRVDVSQPPQATTGLSKVAHDRARHVGVEAEQRNKLPETPGRDTRVVDR